MKGSENQTTGPEQDAVPPPGSVPTPETTEGDDRQPSLLPAPGAKAARLRVHHAASVALSIPLDLSSLLSDRAVH
jgi:hypothetical protein